MTYSSSVIKDGKVLGVMRTDLYFDDFKNAIEKTKIYDSGYMTLMNSNFDFLYYPNKDIKNLKDISNDSLLNLGNSIKNSTNQYGILQYTLNGQPKTMAFYKLSNGWILTANPLDKEMFAGLDKIYIGSLIVVAVALIITIFLGLILGKTLSRTLTTFMSKFNQGDLTVMMEVKSNDELGVMSKDFNLFIQKLHATIADINNVIDKANSYNITISQTMDNVMNGANSKYYQYVDIPVNEGILQLRNSLDSVTSDIKKQTESTEEALANLEEVSANTSEMYKKLMKL